jgi:hypothetical protein
MSKDPLADDFDGNAGTGGIGGSIPAQIVRPQRNADHFPGLGHHHPGCLIGDRKYLIIDSLAAFSGIVPKPVGNLLRNEHHLMLPAAFGPRNISFRPWRSLAVSLSTSPIRFPPGHQSQDQPVTNFGRPENDLVHSILFEDVPIGGDFWMERLPHHRRIAGILKIRAQVVVHEIEKRC